MHDGSRHDLPGNRLGVCLAVMLMVALTMPGLGSAQESLPEQPSLREEPRSFGEIRFGSLFLKPTLQVADLGIDTNVFNDTTRPRQDFVSMVQPGFQFGFKSSRSSVVADTHAGLVYYRRSKGERSVNPSGTVAVEQRFSRHFSAVSDWALGWSTERRGFEIDSRPKTFSKSGSAGVRMFARRYQADLGASYSETVYDESARFLGVQLSETLNRITRTAGVQLKYSLTPYTAVTLGTEAIADRFPGSRIRNTDSGQVLAGIEMNPRALIAGRAQVGYRLAMPLNDRTPDFSGVVGSAGVSWTWRDQLSVGVGAERNFDYSYQPDRFYFLYHLYEASIRQALWRRLDVAVRASYTTLTHRAFIAPEVSSQPSREYLIETGGSLGVHVIRGTRVGVFVQQWERRSGGRPYKTLRTGLELTLGRLKLSERGVTIHGLGR